MLQSAARHKGTEEGQSWSGGSWLSSAATPLQGHLCNVLPLSLRMQVQIEVGLPAAVMPCSSPSLHSLPAASTQVPIEVGLPDAVTAVAAGERHTLCLTSGGDVWSFGANESGQLGLGAADDKKHAEPRVIKELQGTLGV